MEHFGNHAQTFIPVHPGSQNCFTSLQNIVDVDSFHKVLEILAFLDLHYDIWSATKQIQFHQEV